MKKKTFFAVTFVAALVLALSVPALRPVVVCRIDVPDNYPEAIESQSEGLYSSKVPLVPICVSVDSFTEGRVYYTIYYFPLGTVGMSYTENDGYNIEKPLTGL